jgi:hypothetical protein
MISHKQQKRKEHKMSNMGFKILAKFCQEKDVTDAHKEGILLGMHIMGLQSEKWFDNEKHATAFRMDTWDECGFSGWREIYEHTKGFLEAEQPESEEEVKERLEKNYEKIYAEKMAEKQQKMMEYKRNMEYKRRDEEYKRNLKAVAPEAAAEKKINGDDEEMTWEQLKEEMKTKKNETVSDESDVSDMEVTDGDEDEFEVVDNEESEWTQYTFENVEYLVGPKADLGRVVLETEDYQPVGVFEGDTIVFEDNLQVANHFQRVRESTIPEDPEEAFDLITTFLEDNYGDLCFNDYQESTCPYAWSLHVFQEQDAFDGGQGKWFYFGVEPAYSSSASKSTNTLGKNMGEVMKGVESLL